VIAESSDDETQFADKIAADVSTVYSLLSHAWQGLTAHRLTSCYLPLM